MMGPGSAAHRKSAAQHPGHAFLIGGTQLDAIHSRPTQISRFRLLSLLIVIYSKPKAKSPK
jgi:hypothetical protein